MDDTFLHLVDGWWARELQRLRDAGGIDDGLDFDGCSLDDEVEEGFRASVEKEWLSLHGGSDYAETRRLLEDVLAMWRSIEPKRRTRQSLVPEDARDRNRIPYPGDTYGHAHCNGSGGAHRDRRACGPQGRRARHPRGRLAAA